MSIDKLVALERCRRDAHYFIFDSGYLKTKDEHDAYAPVKCVPNQPGDARVAALAGNRSLQYQSLKIKPTQDWTLPHVAFNSLGHTEANLYLGCWGGQTGSLWWDDATLEEVGLLNVIRREGAPLRVQREGGEALVESRDFERVVDPRMGNKPGKGAYDIWHEPPLIKTALPEGTRLRVSYYHVVTVYDDQAMICPSEPRTVELLRDQARRMHAAWGMRDRGWSWGRWHPLAFVASRRMS